MRRFALTVAEAGVAGRVEQCYRLLISSAKDDRKAVTFLLTPDEVHALVTLVLEWRDAADAL